MVLKILPKTVGEGLLRLWYRSINLVSHVDATGSRSKALPIGGKIYFFVGCHFRAHAELRGKWVLRGEPALIDSTSPSYGEKASYNPAVCLESGEAEWMALEGNSNGNRSVAFLKQLRHHQGGRLNVIWHNAPAYRGEALREYLRTPRVELRLMNLPGYSPDFNADEEPSRVGPERRQVATCAWGAGPQCRRGRANSSADLSPEKMQ